MVPLSESIGVTSTLDHTTINTSNGSPRSLSFAKVLCKLYIFYLSLYENYVGLYIFSKT